MSKKRNKSPANNASSGNKWESNIITTELNEDNWSYSLSIIVENIPEDIETINYINKGVLTGLRKKFTLITMEKIIQLINEFGNPKSKKGKEAPVNFEICETGKLSVDKKEPLSMQYVAKFIKWIMLTNKIEDLKNIGDANKKIDGKASKAKKGADKNERAKSSGGKKGSQVAGKRSPEPPSIKQDNKLRKRGDPDPDIQYIDDEPDDGSSRYFVVSGLVDCQLLEALAEIGCIATSVVKITRDIHIPVENIDKVEDIQDKASIASDKDNENNDNLYEKQLENLKSFWLNLNMVLNNNKQLLNTPIVTLVAKHLMFPIEKDNEEMKNKCSMDLFESLAVLMYDLLDLKRQWQNYLTKSKLIALPIKAIAQNNDENTPRESVKEGAQISTGNAESNLDVIFDKLDMNYYNYLMQDIPVESTSIYLQMSAMLDQVEITSGEKIPNWDLNKSDLSPELNEDTADILRKLTENLYLPKEDLLDLQNTLKVSTNNSDENKDNGKNVPIHALDSITLRDREIETKNFGKNGVMGHELQMLVASFRHFDLLKVIPVDDKVTRKRAARLQELIKYLSNTGLSNIEINFAIKIFILENLTLSGVDENGCIRINSEDGFFQKNIHQVWDDPYMIINEVTQSIIDGEINMSKKENVNIEKEHPSFILSENGSLKSENYPDGILKSSRLSSRSQSPEQIRSTARKSSVHFLESERVESPTMLTETQFDMMAMLNDQENGEFQDILLDYLLNLRKRNFSEWCFEEFYEPHVLLQIIHQAIYKLPYIDIYNQRRVDGQLVVLHNPFHPDTKFNQQSWNQWLHSNVGFRNYLDFVNDKITDWNRDQEAIYQANLLSRELQTVEPEVKEPETKGKPSKANDKSKKSKPSKSRSRSSSRASSADETSTKELNVVLPGSLKAQKIEQEKINKAKEEEEMRKEQKRQLSAQKKVEKDLAKGADKAKDNKRPSSKASNKSKTKKTAFEDSGDSFEKENPEIDTDRVDGEDYWPFISYNLGDNLAHFSGNVAHLFPSDGSTIRVFKMQKLLDTTSVRVSVITTQSHVFTIHIIDPTYSPLPQIDNYDQVLEQFLKSKNICHYGASTCSFNDGITIAASNNGYTGTYAKNKSTNEVKVDEALSQQSNDPAGNGNRNGSFQGGEASESTGKLTSHSNSFTDHMDFVDFPNIILATPDGVQVSLGYELTDKENERNLLLFMSKSKLNTKQTNLSETSKNSISEIGRYITSDGRIISIFNNDSIKVLFSDGTVAVSHLAVDSSISQEEEVEESKLEKANAKESPIQKKKIKQSKSISVEPQTPLNAIGMEESKQTINYFRKWTITLSNGEIYETIADLNSIFGPKPSIEPNESKNEEGLINEESNEVAEIIEIPEKKSLFKSHQSKEPLLVSCATDPSTGETLVTRSDGTLLLVSQDAGIFLSEHFDGTRFTKYFNVEKLPNRKNENGEIAKSKINELLLIESKQYPSITIDLTNGKIETRFGSMGSLLSNVSGHHIFRHSDNTEIEYRPDGEIIFTASNNSQMTYLQPDGPCSYVFNPTSNIICEIIDSEGTEFIIDVNGDYDVKINKKNEKPIYEPTGDPEQDNDQQDNDQQDNDQQDNDQQDNDQQDNDQQDNDQQDNDQQDNDQMRPSNSAISMSNDNNGNIRKYDQHAPRIFTINSNGSGSELLRYRDIVDTLVNSEIDEDYFHCREEIQDSPQILAHTILHPDYKNKPWRYEYSRKTVLPKGLTCRDMKSFPAKENKVNGPPFAMGIGRGLEIHTNPIMSKQVKKPKKNFRQEQWLNPMQFQQFYHYPIIGNDIRNNFAVQLVEYNKKILHQRQHYKDLEIVDDRSDEEISLANEIQKKFETLKYSNKEIMSNAVDSLAQINQPHQQSQDEVSFKKSKFSEFSQNKNRNPNQRKLDIILEQERINKEKEIENKLSLKNKIVPKYFTSIYGKDFISNQAMDLQSLNKSMKLFPVSRDGTCINELELTRNIDKTINNEIETSQLHESDPTLPYLQSDCLKQSFENVSKEKKKSTESKLIIKKKEKNYLYYDSSLFIPNAPKRIPASSNLNLPNYLYSQRPVIEPNIQQALIEDPVRRKMYTTSLIGGSKFSQILQRQTRGINVLPARVDTGLLKEGQNYIFKIKLINTGPESSFFKIKQPPSSTGIWVEFLPGPIAAGLSRKLNIHIYAIANNLDANNSNISLFEHLLQITTNTDKLVIPIVGRVMTADKYDSIYPTQNNNVNNLSTLSESDSVRSNSNLGVPVLLQ